MLPSFCTAEVRSSNLLNSSRQPVTFPVNACRLSSSRQIRKKSATIRHEKRSGIGLDVRFASKDIRKEITPVNAFDGPTSHVRKEPSEAHFGTRYW
jgi:hypothetical protein